MTRQDKAQLISDLTEKFKESDHFYIADTSGLTVAEINKFREMCFNKGVEYKLVKNTLIKKALEKTSSLTTSFKPVRKIAICGECGFKDEPFEDKCPKCKSPYVV